MLSQLILANGFLAPVARQGLCYTLLPNEKMLMIFSPLLIGLREVANTLYTQEFCANGALCNKSDADALVKLLNTTTLDLIVLTVGTGSKLVTEHRDAKDMDLFGFQHQMLELVSVHAPNTPVVVLVYSGGPVNISDVVASPQVG